MPNCAVAECQNCNQSTKGTDIKYFRFPKKEDLAKQWIIACRRGDNINLKNATICSIHFEEKYIEIPLKQRLLNYSPKNARHLMVDAVPTLNLPGGSLDTVKKRKAEERLPRIAKRTHREEVEDIMKSSTSSLSCTLETLNAETIPELPKSDEQQFIPTLSNTVRDQAELVELRQKVYILESQNKNLLKEIEEAESAISHKYNSLLARVFTPGQIRKLLNPKENMRDHWSTDDIASAISLRSVSAKAYRYLRANNYPLPAMTTLRNWAGNFDVNEGILKSVITLMKKKSSDFSILERLCVLTFDEVYVSNKMDIAKKQEQAVGPHKACQTVMIRGLISNWKQPIYYKFDQPMSKETLEEIISQLFRANFTVVAISSDMGPGNISVWNKLNVGHNKNCFFVHPCDNSLKIFVFADVPHLIKLVRNHLIDKGFIIDDKLINIDYFKALINISTTKLTYAHKLTQQHFNIKGSMRQRLRPAVQLLSNSVAKAIKYCGESDLMPKNSFWKEASDMVQLFNDWFDLLNSRSKFTQNCPGRNAFGTDIDNQRTLLDKVSLFVKSMRVGKHIELIPFQKGILLTNRSLSEMYEYLKGKHNVEYILTARLNQDVLENFFAYIRGMGGSNDHPSPLDFRYRLRCYILGKHSAAMSTENRNTIASKDKCLLDIFKNSVTSDVEAEEVCLTQKMLCNLPKPEEPLEEKEHVENEIMSISFVEPPYLEEGVIDKEIMQLMQNLEVNETVDQESLKYVAGFVAFKFKHKYSLGTPTASMDLNKAPDWIQSVSRDSLLHPNDELWEVALKLESEFHKMHGNSLSKEEKIFQKLADKTMSQLKTTSVPYEVILYFARTRTYIRLRDLNRKISFKNTQRKLYLDKKMLKTNQRNVRK